MTEADLRQRVADAVDDVFERWMDGLNGKRPQDAITDAVMDAIRPDPSRHGKS